MKHRAFQETAEEAIGRPSKPRPFHKHMMSASSEAILRVTSVVASGIWCTVEKADQRSLIGTVIYIGRDDPLIRDARFPDITEISTDTRFTLKSGKGRQELRKAHILEWQFPRDSSAEHARPGKCRRP